MSNLMILYDGMIRHCVYVHLYIGTGHVAHAHNNNWSKSERESLQIHMETIH